MSEGEWLDKKRKRRRGRVPAPIEASNGMTRALDEQERLAVIVGECRPDQMPSRTPRGTIALLEQMEAAYGTPYETSDHHTRWSGHRAYTMEAGAKVSECGTCHMLVRPSAEELTLNQFNYDPTAERERDPNEKKK